MSDTKEKLAVTTNLEMNDADGDWSQENSSLIKNENKIKAEVESVGADQSCIKVDTLSMTDHHDNVTTGLSLSGVAGAEDHQTELLDLSWAKLSTRLAVRSSSFEVVFL